MARRRKLEDLDWKDEQSLWLGPDLHLPDDWTREQYVEYLAPLWVTYREQLMYYHTKNGCRPWAWWALEQGSDVQRGTAEEYEAERRRKVLFLSAHGHLTDAEVDKYEYEARTARNPFIQAEAVDVLAVLDSEVVAAEGGE